MKNLFFRSILVCLFQGLQCMEPDMTQNLQELSTNLTSLEQLLIKQSTIPTIRATIKDPQTLVVGYTTIHLIEGDITKLYSQYGIQVDAIVNAANEKLGAGSGVCAAIFRAAGFKALADYISKHFPKDIQTGKAVTTPSFNLSSQGIKAIIHAVGPVYRLYTPTIAEKLLRDAYINSIKQALTNTITSIAFPFISSLSFGYPLPEAAKTALTSVINYLNQTPTSLIKDIYFVLFSTNDLNLFKTTLHEIVTT